MFIGIGLGFILAGASMLESECLLVPALVAAVGVVLTLAGMIFEEEQ